MIEKLDNFCVTTWLACCMHIMIFVCLAFAEVIDMFL